MPDLCDSGISLSPTLSRSPTGSDASSFPRFLLRRPITCGEPGAVRLFAADWPAVVLFRRLFNCGERVIVMLCLHIFLSCFFFIRLSPTADCDVWSQGHKVWLWESSVDTSDLAEIDHLILIFPIKNGTTMIGFVKIGSLFLLWKSKFLKWTKCFETV